MKKHLLKIRDLIWRLALILLHVILTALHGIMNVFVCFTLHFLSILGGGYFTNALEAYNRFQIAMLKTLEDFFTSYSGGT